MENVYKIISEYLFKTEAHANDIEFIWIELTPAQKMVLENRIGAGMTLAEVGDLFGKVYGKKMSVENVRQHQKGGLKKIKKLVYKLQK